MFNSLDFHANTHPASMIRKLRPGASRGAALVLGRRDVARRRICPLTEEILFGLLHQILAGFGICETQPVLVDQHLLVNKPALPRLYGYIFKQALAKFPGEGRPVQSLGVAAELYALHHSCHVPAMLLDR